MFQDSFSLYSPGLSWNSVCRSGWPQTHRDPPASAFQELGLKVCTVLARLLLGQRSQTESQEKVGCVSP